MEALETRQLGSARRSRVQSDRTRRITAGHEAGHALAAFFGPHIEPPARVTIVPRGATGGHTRIEQEDTELMDVAQLKAQLVYCMGGRAAEMLLEENCTTGATSDLQKATEIARHMVGQAGMGPFLAQVPLDGNGRDPRLAEVITEADKLIREALETALTLLREHEDELHTLRDTLLEVESLDLETLKQMFGEPVPAYA
jgi:cell division protease FtsH